jgi:hypothetical protein
MMQSFLSKGITAGQKGFDQIANEAKVFHEEKELLEGEIASCMRKTRD